MGRGSQLVPIGILKQVDGKRGSQLVPIGILKQVDGKRITVSTNRNTEASRWEEDHS